MIKVGILGASGYAGNELVRLLLNHKEAQICYIGSQNNVGENYKTLFLNTPLDLEFENKSLDEISNEIDVLFCATPHKFSANLLNENLLKKMKIIDLSADFRLKNPLDYENYYGFKHENLELLKNAVYGLCELNKKEIKKANLIANPGCYTTCSILSLYPLLSENLIDEKSIIIDAKSGVSGAGRGAKIENLFCEVNENIKAYGLCKHRHLPEIEEWLGYAFGGKITLQFTPHLIPMQRGILATCYASLKENASKEKIKKAYKKFYKDEYFVRIYDEALPQTRFVRGTNFFDVGFVLDERTNKIIVVGALDNLIKGAAGQAIQNMNLIFGFDEKMGLDSLAGL